jgi:hypothetical protein
LGVTCAAILIAVVAASSGTTQARGYLPQVKQQIADMSVNGSGIRDTARVLKISPTTVIEALKKHRHLKAVNEARLAQLNLAQTQVVLLRVQEKEAELDEMWSFVQSKQQQRWRLSSS